MLTCKVIFTFKDVLNFYVFLLANCSSYVRYFWKILRFVIYMYIYICECVYIYVFLKNLKIK